MGEFVGGGKPEFEGAIERALALETDAGEPPKKGVVQAVAIFRGGGRFERQKGGTQSLGKECRGGKNGGHWRQVR